MSWKSEAFAQIREAYGVNGIPYLRIYGTDGQLLGEGCLEPPQIRSMIEAQAIRR